jgi:hypothetical protein
MAAAMASLRLPTSRPDSLASRAALPDSASAVASLDEKAEIAVPCLSCSMTGASRWSSPTSRHCPPDCSRHGGCPDLHAAARRPQDQMIGQDEDLYREVA